MIRETGPYDRFNPKSRETFISGTNDRGRRRRNILFSLFEGECKNSFLVLALLL